MLKISWSMATVVFALLLGCGHGSGGAAPGVTCPAPGLPNPNASFLDTVEALVVVPARASLRDASEEELGTYRDFVMELQGVCGAVPPGPTCEVSSLRAGLTALPAPDHPSVFTDIDGSFEAALASAHGDYLPADRACDGQAEEVCDARGITGGLARAICELGAGADTTGNP